MPGDFRKKMTVVGLDVETMGLDAEHKQLTTIGLGFIGKPVEAFFIERPQEEHNGIRWVRKKIEENSPCRVVTWRDFDVGFIRTRAALNGMPDPFAKGGEYLDLHECAAKNIQYDGGDIHLVNAASLFGLNVRKIPSEEMPALYTRWLAGDRSARDRIVEHCKRDIDMMMGVYQRLKCPSGQKL